MSPAADVTGHAHGFGIYIHWPYCTRICPYCDFNVYAAKTRDTSALIEAICADLKAQHSRFGAAVAPTTVYLGGGTPSLIGPRGLAQIFATIEMCFGAPQLDISLEANPLNITQEALSDWKSLGVTRLSLGVQSLRDDALAFLGRDHTSDQGRRAVELALAAFPNTSVDLIYARPGQSLSEWQGELRDALDLGAPHLSLYELTIEQRTVFGARAARGELIAVDDDAQADLYEATQAVCEQAGLPAYEVSNHAADPTFESSHNHIYWASGDWIGVGPGAHGRLTRKGKRIATQALRRPTDYIAAGYKTEPMYAVETLSSIDTLRELIAMGLRTRRGMNINRLKAAGLTLEDIALEDLVAEGVLECNRKAVTLTAKGRLLADYVTAKLSP